ncbi:GyrI-like domain-containing protein [Psychrobacillus lasiicapitis]|uniref:GyrI-like domain-containing protein n=2 Tax=Psychrobacillus lasiicapitis TaxID=1636719 RepID=A0A544SWX5_9BACI|nr:GyrI-like domain-containing protein [Psychrobacillus lasiicapitis]
MEFRKVKREFKLVGMKNRGFFANFGKEVPIFAHQLLKRADEIKNHTATEIALYEPKRAADHIEGNYYVGLIVNGASNEIPSGMELIEITHDYMTVRGRISDIADLHSKLSNWGEQQGYKRNLESYIIETYHPIENSEEEVEIYLPIYS